MLICLGNLSTLSLQEMMMMICLMMKMWRSKTHGSSTCSSNEVSRVKQIEGHLLLHLVVSDSTGLRISSSPSSPEGIDFVSFFLGCCLGFIFH